MWGIPVLPVLTEFGEKIIGPLQRRRFGNSESPKSDPLWEALNGFREELNGFVMLIQPSPDLLLFLMNPFESNTLRIKIKIIRQSSM